MPCDNVAVVRARLDADVGAEILRSSDTVDALVRWLRRVFGACAVASTTADALHLTIGAPLAALEVRLSRRDGLVTTGRDAAAVARAGSRVEAFARDLAAAALQERLVRSIRRRYVVEGDAVDPTGYRTLTVSLPT